MTGFSKFDRPYAIRDAAGNTVYESASFIQGIEDVFNGGVAAIGRGEAVIHCLSTTGGRLPSIFPRWDYLTTGADVIPTCRMSGEQTQAAASVNFIGVAQEVIPVGATGRVCTDGVSAVKVVSGGGTNTAGQPALGSATVGSVTVAATAAVGQKLGILWVPAGTAALQSGSLTQIIVRIAPA